MSNRSLTDFIDMVVKSKPYTTCKSLLLSDVFILNQARVWSARTMSWKYFGLIIISANDIAFPCIGMSVCLSVCLSICLSVCLSVCLSNCPFCYRPSAWSWIGGLWRLPWQPYCLWSVQQKKTLGVSTQCFFWGRLILKYIFQYFISVLASME